ncbi:MAG: alpha-ketoacid dehydrogenase subunit beta [Magnetococcales bacterium]|nr:alpha-ketoacid dehydrogenase subunit beta [Magnetococcales bacterium]
MTTTRQITYREALSEAMAQEMRRDPSVFVYGIDVADHKRIFGSSNGLVEEFGDQRCFSTPLSEDAMTGFGLGAALTGMRPVHVHMRVDFMLLAMNQIVNMLSSHYYGSGGTTPVPMVIRAVVGRGWGQSFQHNKTLHSWLAHIPGLKVVTPSTPRDAKGMLVSAIRDDNPVIFIEHRWFYDAVGEVPEGDGAEPLNGCRVLRPGKDITIVATSWMTVEALQAADVLARRGITAEVIDARTIAPFDVSEVVTSVQKSGHCIVVDNDWVHCGFGAEVAAQVYDHCYGSLKSPVTRLGFVPAPCPCTRPLENAFYTGATEIIRCVEEKLGLDQSDLSGENFFSYENKFKGPF